MLLKNKTNKSYRYNKLKKKSMKSDIEMAN